MFGSLMKKRETPASTAAQERGEGGDGRDSLSNARPTAAHEMDSQPSRGGGGVAVVGILRGETNTACPRGIEMIWREMVDDMPLEARQC